jgi:hypothetical protein
MELDDLKETWNQSTQNKIKNADIMNIIKHKTYGPISALKKAFIKQIKLMIILPIMLVAVNFENVSHVFTSILFWSYFAFCIGLIIFSWVNYRLATKLETMDTMVKSTIEQQVRFMESLLKWKIIGLRIALCYFVLLLEVLPYIQHYRMLDKWHELSPVTRFGCYAGFFLLQYLVSDRVNERRFGSHIKYLKELVNEMNIQV